MSNVFTHRYLTLKLLAKFLFAAFVCTFSPNVLAADDLSQMELCPQEKIITTVSDFDPLREFGKSVMSSGIGTQSGRNLIKITSTISTGYLIKEAGMISGRTLVWIFELGNPFAVALGFIFIPTTSAKCDVVHSNDPDCEKLKPCIANIQQAEVQPDETESPTSAR
jgi:hypothetical protein